MVGEMNARLEEGFKRYEADARAAEVRRQRAARPLTPLESVKSRVSLASGRKAQLELAVALLCKRPPGGFHPEELMVILMSVGWDEAAVEDALEGMLAHGMLLEPRPGFLRIP